MLKPIIEVENLSKRYHLGAVGATTLRESFDSLWYRRNYRKKTARSDEFWALRDISFSLAGGEVFGIIGKNGAGKSTLLKILSRVTDPTSGKAVLRGGVASLLEVGTGFHPELTGRENIYLNGAILGMRKKEIDEKLDEIIDFAEVQKFSDTPVKHYSSGMYVRLAFAVAAHLEADILIIDEVLAVGDVAFQKKCLGRMNEVSRKGRTVLFVSHNLSAIAQLTSRCLVLAGGKTAFIGPTEEAISSYLLSSAPVRSFGRLPVESIGCEARQRGIPGVEFSEIGLAGEGKTEVWIGGALEIDVVLIASRPTESLRFGFTVRDHLGAAILTGFSPVFSLTCAGRSAVRLLIEDLFLAPGFYDLSMSVGYGVANEPKVEYDILLGWLRFSIAPAFGGSSPIGEWSSHWGRVVHMSSSVKNIGGTNP